jgi:hypothetical protein
MCVFDLSAAATLWKSGINRPAARGMVDATSEGP